MEKAADMERLEQQMAFVRELDKLKRVQRQTWLTDTSRKENSAEHSWHVAVMALPTEIPDVLEVSVADLEHGDADAVEDAVIGAWELQSGR